ncbi:hypothetical protein M758_UG294000 [Ceratodon purpureus]|nr:hypothetical protein M758_UG294000 [Ceratodon purpureus]
MLLLMLILLLILLVYTWGAHWPVCVSIPGIDIVLRYRVLLWARSLHLLWLLQLLWAASLSSPSITLALRFSLQPARHLSSYIVDSIIVSSIIFIASAHVDYVQPLDRCGLVTCS